MKVAFQIEHLDPARGGAETYVAAFTRQLIDQGHTVHIVAAGIRDAPAGAVEHELGDLWFREAAAVCAGIDADVTVGVGKCSGMNVFQPHGGTFFGSRRQNLALIRHPFVRAVRGFFNSLIPKHRAAAALERAQYAQTDPRPHFIAISKMVRDDMIGFHGVPQDRLHLIYNGVDTDEFSPQRCSALRASARADWNLAPGTVCFLLVAHNFRLKGVRELIEAVAEARRYDRDFVVMVVGKGNAAAYQRLARRMGCAERIRFAGSTREVVRCYAAADVYVQPTWYDPCSLVVLEAWACGLPVITTRFNGAGELMEAGREGFLIDSPECTSDLAARMVELLDPDTRALMGQAGRELALRHTLADNFAAMMRVFELAAAERRRK